MSQQQPPLSTKQKNNGQQFGCILFIIIITCLIASAWAYNSWATSPVAGQSNGYGATVYKHTGQGYTTRFTPTADYTIAWNCSDEENILISVINVATGDYNDQWQATCNFDGRRDIVPTNLGSEYYIHVIASGSWTITVFLPDANPSTSYESDLPTSGTAFHGPYPSSFYGQSNT